LGQREYLENSQLLATEKERILNNLDTKKPAKEAVETPNVIHVPQAGLQTQRFATKEPKKKPKTRPDINLSEQGQPNQPPPVDLERTSLEVPIHTIKPRPMDVVALMFPLSAQDKGKVRWRDFVAFKEEVGFVPG